VWSSTVTKPRLSKPGGWRSRRSQGPCLCVRQSRASSALSQPDWTGLHRIEVGSAKPKGAVDSHIRAIYDIFEGTAEIQQLVISRAISGMHIK